MIDIDPDADTDTAYIFSAIDKRALQYKEKVHFPSSKPTVLHKRIRIISTVKLSSSNRGIMHGFTRGSAAISGQGMTCSVHVGLTRRRNTHLLD